ncbi:MAG: flagellin [Limnochordia bacterium]|jgi:flagellin
MRINNNIMALNAHRQLGINQTNSSKSMEKLSSGFRINRAGDDAAGLAISEKMRGQIRGLKQAQRNAQDGISLIQTAEGALNETHAILQRMRELATQAATDTNTEVDRLEIQKEIDQLAQEITRIANNTEFNTQTLMNGGIQESNLGKLGFHIGANEGQFIELEIEAMDAFSLGVARDVVEYTGTASGSLVSNVTVGDTVGAGVVDGATITLDAAVNTGVKASVTVKGLTITAADVGTQYNGYSVSIVDDSNEGIVVDHNARTITLTLDLANDASNDISGLSVKDQDGNDDSTFSFSGDASGLGVADAGNDLDATAGGADANLDEVAITLDDGTATQVVTVASDATSVAVTTGVFAGLSFDITGNVADLDSASDSIDISGEAKVASAAQFSNGEKVADAEAWGGIDVSSRAAANRAVTDIQTAIDKVSAERSKLGAVQNRLEHTIANLGTSAENLQAAESRIRDLDMAEEIMAFTKNNILQQAATAMLAQANMAPQSVLQLLG